MFEVRLEHCRRHLAALEKSADDEFTALELGTGWFPTMVIGMYLCGAKQVWGIDIDPLLRRSRVRRVLDLFCEYDDAGQLAKFLPGVRPERMRRLRELVPLLDGESPESFLARMNIHMMVRDARNSGLPDGSVDLFFSTGVLEYIPRAVLRGILDEFRRLATPRAVMSHWISMIDQFSYFDKSITPFNYLKYTAKQWRYLDSPMIPQNRLRISDYRALFNEAGFTITSEEGTPGSAKDLESIKLAPEFSSYSKEDLLVLTAWITAKPATR